jgi:hypothetical protein
LFTITSTTAGRPAPGHHLVESPLQRRRQVAHIGHTPRAFHERREHHRVVGVLAAFDLLQNALADHVGVRVAGEDEHGHGVHVRGG